MTEFHYQDGELYCEAVPLRLIAEQVGTPCYVYSHATVLRQFRAFDAAFNDIPHLVAYAVKANSTLALLRLLGKEGAGADIVSGGELYRALQAGIPPQRIVFAGVGKSDAEIRAAIAADILMFNVESSAELRAIDRVAGAMSASGGTTIKARVALRINPDIDPQTHPYISTGLKKSKFGISAERALEEFKLATTLPHIEIVGVHKHIGSQLTQVSPFVDAMKKVLLLLEQLVGIGVTIRYLNVGGGLGITYQDETPPKPHDLAQAIAPLIKDLKCRLIFEPGRSIVGNAGVLVTKVLYHKANPDKTFLIVDAAMNDLIRPSLYGAYHEIKSVRECRDRLKKQTLADVVGPVCESGDFLAKDRMMTLPDPGDLLAVMSAGAYGFSMASNYNSRPRVAEALVRGGEFHVIRAREDYADLVRGETIPAFLTKEGT